MIENRLELNKKPIYELPNEVVVAQYRYSANNKDKSLPSFTPTICINGWGDILGEVIEPKSKTLEYWIKTDNEKLLQFIRGFDWYSVCPNHNNAPMIPVWLFKKIILEEFYGVKNGK